MSDFFKNKRIIVTGGEGFLGTCVVEKLKQKKCKNINIIKHSEYDLTNMLDVKLMYDSIPTDIIIHTAGIVGGINYNLNNPGKAFYDNAIMGIQLLEEARKRNIEKFVLVGTVCSYPKNITIPFKEDDLWNGYPEETNATYGLSKKMLFIQADGYKKQYGLNTICLLLANLYGPKDNLNLKDNHVVIALIKKCIDAINNGDKNIICWGDGTPTREFLYVEDAAEGILLATEYYNKINPINIGTGIEISINELVQKIVKLTGFNGNIIWDNMKPNGQPRRCLDVSKAQQYFGFKAQTSFDDGLKNTIEWYKNNKV